MGLFGDQAFWETLASIATSLGFVVVTVATIVALRQLRESARARRLEAILKVYEMMGSESARAARRSIYVGLDSAPNEVSATEREAIEQVSVMFDMIGNIVEMGLVSRTELFETHCEVIIRCWRKLQPYIEWHRLVLGGRHAASFERLAGLAEEYYSNNFPDEELRIVNIWTPQTP